MSRFLSLFGFTAEPVEIEAGERNLLIGAPLTPLVQQTDRPVAQHREGRVRRRAFVYDSRNGPRFTIVQTQPHGHARARVRGWIREQKFSIALMARPRQADEARLAYRLDQRLIELQSRPGRASVPAP